MDTDLDLHAEFRLTSASLPLVGLASTATSATFELDEVLHSRNSSTILLCWVEAEPFAEIETHLNADDSIAEWSCLQSHPDRRLYRLQMERTEAVLLPIESEFIEKGSTPLHATITRDGWLMRARFPDRQTLIAYRDDCEQRDLSFSLEQLYRPASNESRSELAVAGLTEKQREAVERAFEAGYYDLPRETTLSDVADTIGISRRALADRLRRAERQLVSTAIRNDRETDVSLGP